MVFYAEGIIPMLMKTYLIPCVKNILPGERNTFSKQLQHELFTNLLYFFFSFDIITLMKFKLVNKQL